jgi:hemerythrin-like domain-containing protein
MKCTRLLMIDHEVIRQALRVLQAINEDIRSGKTVERGDIQSLLTFLREFADGSHHVKEEGILFPALMHAGMPSDAGPLEVMNYEHVRGRALTAAMQDALDRTRMDDFLNYSSRYIELLTSHIEKEEYVLFPKTEQILSDDEDETVAADLDHFEAMIVGTGMLERRHQMIEFLASKYLNAAAVLC